MRKVAGSRLLLPVLCMLLSQGRGNCSAAALCARRHRPGAFRVGTAGENGGGAWLAMKAPTGVGILPLRGGMRGGGGGGGGGKGVDDSTEEPWRGRTTVGGRKGELKKRERDKVRKAALAADGSQGKRTHAQEAGGGGEGGGEGGWGGGNTTVGGENRLPTDRLPTMVELMRFFNSQPAQIQQELAGLAGHWEITNQTANGRAQGDDDELGLRFDTVWDEEQTHQIGVKVIAVFEGNSPDDTGGAAIGDWLISVGGIKVGKKSLAEIGRLICDQHVGTAAENREKRRSGADDEDEDDEEEEENEDEKVREKVRLVLQRGMGGDSPEEGGDFYHIDLQRGWLTGEEEDGDGFGSAVQDDKEREAREFLRKYVSGSSTKASVPG